MSAKKSKIDLATRAALLYYDKGLSQNEIAKVLSISRSYVSQLITLAKNLGIVKITIQANEFVKELDFAERFGLKQVYILPSQSAEYSDSAFDTFCSQQTTRLLKNARCIGVNLGETVKRVINALSTDDLRDCSAEYIVQIMGGCTQHYSGSSGPMPNELVFYLGNLMGCRCMYLDCPVTFSNPAIRDLLLQEESIQSVCEMWDQLDIVLMGMGTAENSILVRDDEDLKKQVLQAGAVADINFNFFDINGNLIDLFSENKLVMPAEQMKKIPCKVAFAYGIEKAEAILAALRANMIDVLFTDSITTNEIVALDRLSGMNP